MARTRRRSKPPAKIKQPAVNEIDCSQIGSPGKRACSYPARADSSRMIMASRRRRLEAGGQAVESSANRLHRMLYNFRPHPARPAGTYEATKRRRKHGAGHLGLAHFDETLGHDRVHRLEAIFLVAFQVRCRGAILPTSPNSNSSTTACEFWQCLHGKEASSRRMYCSGIPALPISVPFRIASD
jgi:hypothetical protein